MKERNNAFDLLCGICIIRMMMLHITGNCGFGEEKWWTTTMEWSYYFMSFFFFKAGYFNKTISGNSKEFVEKKFKQLIIPYITWGIIGNLIFFFFVVFILDPKNSMVQQIRLEHIWKSGQFYGNPPCWFLLSFFIAYVASHLINKIPPIFRFTIPEKIYSHKYVLNIKIHWIILFFPYISWWLWSKGNPLWFSMNNVFFGIFLFYLGRLWHVVIEIVDRNTILVVSFIMLSGFVYMNGVYGGSYTMSENLWKGNFYELIFAIILALCGISGLFLSVNLPRIPVISYIGQHSMVFFVLHHPILTLYKLIRSANVKSIRNNWDDYIIVTLIVFTICFLMVPHIEKNPWLSGRFKKNKNVNSIA